MKNNAERIVELWKKLSSDLSLDIITPFHLKIGTNINLTIPVLLKHFGGKEGMLISDSFESVKDITNEIVSAGYGVSLPDISENDLRRYAAKLFIGMLVDWSWTGPEGKQPEWFLKATARQNRIISQSGNSNNKCIEFDKILADAVDFGFEDYRAGIERATEIAEHFTDLHWQYLSSFWKGRSPKWQECLAQCLRDVQPPVAEDWLIHMMNSADDNLVIRALENFRNLQRDRVEKKPVPIYLIPRIRELWKQHFNFTETQLEQILDDLASGADARK